MLYNVSIQTYLNRLHYTLIPYKSILHSIIEIKFLFNFFCSQSFQSTKIHSKLELNKLNQVLADLRTFLVVIKFFCT